MEPSTDIKKGLGGHFCAMWPTQQGDGDRRIVGYNSLLLLPDSCILGHQILDLAGVSIQTFIRGEFESALSA